MMQELPNKDIKLLCTGIEKAGNYYFVPQFIINKDNDTLDLRENFEYAVLDSHFQVGFNNLLTTFSQQMKKAIEFNPSVKYKNAVGEIMQNNEEVEVEKKTAN